MPTVGFRNADAQNIGSSDHLSVFDRNFFAEWYDAAGGLLFLAADTVPLGTERHNSAPEIFDFSSNILTLTEAGLYLFFFSLTAQQSGSAEMIVQVYLEEDPDTGIFAVVPGTETTMTFFAGFGTLVNYAFLRAGINYRYRLRVQRLGGTVTPTLTANGSKLSVVRMFKNG